MTQLESLVAEPLAGYAPSWAMALWQMQDTRMRTLRWLSKIDPARLDWSPAGETVNTVGSLLYHIALIETDWLYAEILEAPYPQELMDWFPVDVRDADGRLSVVSGEPLERHLARLSAVRNAMLDALRDRPEDDFHRPRTLPQYVVTPAWVLQHLCQHEAEHRGEMMTLLARAPA
jgi:uncharacterized damage-inducible protein DinB